MPKSEDLSRSLEINAIWTFDTEFSTIFNKPCTYVTFKSAVKHRLFYILQSASTGSLDAIIKTEHGRLGQVSITYSLVMGNDNTDSLNCNGNVCLQLFQ